MLKTWIEAIINDMIGHGFTENMIVDGLESKSRTLKAILNGWEKGF